MSKKPKKYWSEKDCQKELVREFNGKCKHKLCVSNIFLYAWESDLISITKSNNIVEFEIKCSKWD